ncbi:MAG: DUF5694 domain-containing protein [Ekhidna sp.]
MKYLLYCSLLFVGLVSEAQDKKVKALLIGTSHWADYGREGTDVTQSSVIDILKDEYQKELKQIAKKITQFGPNKIFVERPVDYQPKLDSLYKVYRSTDWGEQRRNEIFQLGFRVADKMNHEQVFGVDFLGTDFPFDSLVQAMVAAEQFEMMDQFRKIQMNMEKESRDIVSSGASLKEIFTIENSPESRRENFGWYLDGANVAGDLDNNIGSYLASEWISRNVYMYGIIQKYVEAEDDKLMILLGAGHIAVIANLISYNPNWEIVELKDILE